MLPCPRGHDDERGEQRPKRRAGVAADLEDRLRESVPSARCHARDARRLGVKHRRTDADQRRREQEQRREGARDREHAACRPA